MADVLAFTGHRPDKLVGRQAEIDLCLMLYLQERRPDTAIVGMADGFDTYAAIACLELDIPLWCAVPFKGHRSQVDQTVYDFIIANAHVVLYACDEPYRGPWQFQVRNKLMVDRSNRLATCWDGTDGGTANCVRYARQVGRKMDRVWGIDPNV